MYWPYEHLARELRSICFTLKLLELHETMLRAFNCGVCKYCKSHHPIYLTRRRPCNSYKDHHYWVTITSYRPKSILSLQGLQCSSPCLSKTTIVHTWVDPHPFSYKFGSNIFSSGRLKDFRALVLILKLGP